MSITVLSTPCLLSIGVKMVCCLIEAIGRDSIICLNNIVHYYYYDYYYYYTYYIYY